MTCNSSQNCAVYPNYLADIVIIYTFATTNNE